MAVEHLRAVAALIRREREGLLSHWRRQVRELRSAQDLDVPTLNDHVPALIDELADALESCSDETIPEALREGTPPSHGLQRLKDGFDIEEVVAEYNILRGCIHDLLDANDMTLRGKPFHILNRVLDGAIGLAVQAYAAQREKAERARRQEYLAFVAHDLRTPLHAISLATTVLEQTLPRQSANPEQAHMLQTLSRNIHQLDGLVDKVIDENANLLTEIGIKLERRQFDLWPLVEAVIRDLQLIARNAGTRLHNLVPYDLVVYADAGLLRRVFQNLIANAIRHTPGGDVTIGAREMRDEAVYECWVGDNGAGIPRERLEKVFDKLETDSSDDDVSGLGLGLSIVKSFVEAHEGEVSVESEEGVGSTFRFWLPARRR
jgi:signal transduction histidine kinase